MKIHQRESGDVTILQLEGRLVRGVGDELLRDTIDGLLAEGQRRLLLDLSSVPFIDSSGIGELVASKKVTQQLGGDLKLIKLEGRVERTLRLSMILPLFQTFGSEEEALAAFTREG